MTRCLLIEDIKQLKAAFELLHIHLCSFTSKEWDKYRVAFVLQGKPHYVEEDDKVINTKVCTPNMNLHAKIDSNIESI